MNEEVLGVVLVLLLLIGGTSYYVIHGDTSPREHNAQALEETVEEIAHRIQEAQLWGSKSSPITLRTLGYQINTNREYWDTAGRYSLKVDWQGHLSITARSHPGTGHGNYIVATLPPNGEFHLMRARH